MIIPKQNILYKISIFQGLKEYKDDRYPNSIFYLKNDVVYFEMKKNTLWCNQDLVWSIFSNQLKLDYFKTQRIIKDAVGRCTNWGEVTPHRGADFHNSKWKDIKL